MMRGGVVGLQARMGITFRLSVGPDKVVDFVLDTGFDGALTLPAADIAALGLPRVQRTSAILADGSRTNVEVYRGVIFWHGVEIAVAVFAMDSDPLLGTSLLENNYLFVDWVDGGEVRIELRP